ncbi:MAG: hypothetical protein KGL41_03735 [Actinomycetales bacterium]|nr:hypothetical protein [Actinomycetales bacterium]
MNQSELFLQWNKAWQTLVVSQLAPTFLLITTASLVGPLHEQTMNLRLAVIFILLASGILGALAQFWASAQAQAAAKDLAVSSDTATVKTMVQAAKWLNVSKYVTPAIFTVIFVLLVIELH